MLGALFRCPMARTRTLSCLLLLLLLPAALAQNPAVAPPSSANPAPKTAEDWFYLADSLSNLRQPGAPPFHLKVPFQSQPGPVSIAIGRPSTVKDSGVYEETWISPQRWHREVTFGSYHAVEVFADGVRKWQASSDYEPDRVLMLMDALLNPLPDLHWLPQKHKSRWKVKRMNQDGSPHVRVSINGSPDHSIYGEFSYSFLPTGLLAESNDHGLVTRWDNPVSFGRSMAPTHIIIEAMGDNFLTAELTVRSPSAQEETISQLPGAPADLSSGFSPFDPDPPNIVIPYSPAPPDQSFERQLGLGDFVVRIVIDRTGNPSEVDVVAAVDAYNRPDLGAGLALAKRVAGYKFRPASVDGTPREAFVNLEVTRTTDCLSCTNN